MIVWPAKEIKGRISAQNAVKIRAVIKTSFNARQIAEDYLGSNPDSTGNPAMDNVRARSWAMVHVQTNPAPLAKAISRVHAEGWATGNKAARSMIKRTILKSTMTSIVLDPNADVWAGWKPGDEATALLVDQPGGLKTLIDGSQSTARSALNTKYDQIGTALAGGFRSGASLKEMTALVADVIDDPSQALTIATTEMSRATNISAMNTYTEAGLGSVQWYGIDPCPVCAENDGEIVGLGMDFPSGDSEPPAHPNCLCTILPVIDATAFQDVTDQIESAAESGVAAATAREARLTDLMEAVAQDAGAEFHGLEYKLKGKSSVARKIGDAIKTGEARSAKQAVSEMSDLNRYTMKWTNNTYVQGVKDALDSLQAQGYQFRVKNYWEREDYRGINVAVKDRNGKEFELQFHTMESVQVKEELHKLYEEYRVEKSDRKRWNLWRKMTKIAKKIPDPKDYQDLLKVGDLKQVYFTDAKGNVRGGTSSYSKWFKARADEPKQIFEPVKPVKPTEFKPIEPIPVVNEPIKPMEMMFSEKRNAEIESQLKEIKDTYFLSNEEIANSISGNTRIRATVEEFFTKKYQDLKTPSDDYMSHLEKIRLQVEASVQRLEYYVKRNTDYVGYKQNLEPGSALAPARVEKFKEAEVIAKEKVTEALKNGNVTIAIKPNDFYKVIRDGRFKNQFETQTTNGLFDPERRAISEMAAQEIPTEATATERPVYGYITNVTEFKDTVPDEGEIEGLKRLWDNILSVNSKGVNQYGDFRIVLKQSVRDRTTVTIGDSLNGGQLADKIISSNPDLINMGLYSKGITVDGIFPQFRYMEAQISGITTLKDIAAIYYPDGTNVEALRAKLKEAGVDIPLIMTKIRG